MQFSVLLAVLAPVAATEQQFNNAVMVSDQKYP